MWTIFSWTVVLSFQFGQGGGDCVQDLVLYTYTGTVSVTNNGLTCQAWSSQSPHEHTFSYDSLFPDDKSVTAAKNYCRKIWDESRPWCFTTHPDIRWGFCDLAICKDIYRECGGVVQNAPGLITAPDFDGDGLYDMNVDCLWTIQAPEHYVIRYIIEFYEIEESDVCNMDVLMVFEKGNTDRINYCGSSGLVQLQGETTSNILYVQFYSDYSINDEGFNITFRHRKAPNAECGGMLSQSSGWIASPDLDGDGFYDFNLHCSWSIQVDKDKVISFRLLYIDLWPVPNCVADNLDIYDSVTVFISTCHSLVGIEEEEFTTISNVLMVEFGTDNVYTRTGFRLEYKQVSERRCLVDLSGYEGTISVTNNGRRCQAWSAQTPHRHSYYDDSYFPMDGSAAEASNYCREMSVAGRPWCYTMDKNIRWEYCTFTICNTTTPTCGGLILQTFGVIESASLINEAMAEADCLWTIQAKEDQVIRYRIELYEPIDQDQCEEYSLAFFENGKSTIWKTICGNTYLAYEGETLTSTLYVRYYKDINTHLMFVEFYFQHVKAYNKTLQETLRNPFGWISSPDVDGDSLYDFNINYLWFVEGDANIVVLLTPVYIIIEYSPSCSNDFIWIYDMYGSYFTICGFRNDTEADTVESRSNHLYIQFRSNEIISADGFNFSYKLLQRNDDCLSNLLVSDYTGTVSVTNHGYTCQHWMSQTPHSHEIFGPNPELAYEHFNYCRNFGTPYPWCYTTDPYVYTDSCTFSICNETHKKCKDVLHSITGEIVAPDYDKDGFYDLNIDCLWIVEAPEDYLIQFQIYFIDMESTIGCAKDFMAIWQKEYTISSTVLCGSSWFHSGETISNALYVQFYSDQSVQASGFNMSYTQIKASSVPDKNCIETIRNKSGWITAPDKDADGLYDFNLNCVWTVEVDVSMRIRFWLTYIELDVSYQHEFECLTDYIELDQGIGDIYKVCGSRKAGFSTPMKTEANVLVVRFRSNFFDTARGFNLTYEAIERDVSCFDKLKSTPYNGIVSVTNNGIQCQAWSDQTPHNHSENRDVLFPHDGSVSKARNYCRDIWGDGRPWCYTIDKDILMGFCTLRICNGSINSCGGVLHSATGSIHPPYLGYLSYDLNVDCLWIIVAAQNEVIRLTIHYYQIEDSSDCENDALWIYESGANRRSVFCGTRTEKLDGETVSNKLYVHFYSDDSVTLSGFELTFVRKEATSWPCVGSRMDAYGWISAPDRDGDGLYDFNLNCSWMVEVQQDSHIIVTVLYVVLDPCDDESDYLQINDFDSLAAGIVFCGETRYEQMRSWRTSFNRLYIRFVSNYLDVGSGFNLTYREQQGQELDFLLTGEGWIRNPNLNDGGLDDTYMICHWYVIGPEKTNIEVDIRFIKIHDHTDVLKVYKDQYSGGHGKQALIRTIDKSVTINYYSLLYASDVSFLIAYKTVNASKTLGFADLYCPAWISAFDFDLNGLYDYNLRLMWFIRADDNKDNVLCRLIYLDIEESDHCVSDFLAIETCETCLNNSFTAICGVGFKHTITTLRNVASIRYYSDHTVNRFGFNMSFSQITGLTSNECGGILTDSSQYITSVDASGDGLYDDGQLCHWTIRLGLTQVVVFEVLKLDIYVSSGCEFDYLEAWEDHRFIDRYCGKTNAPHFTTESNVLYLLFQADGIRSATGFEAVYFQAEDVKDCLSDYRCLLTDKTIQREYMCDTVSDCHYGDDERFCHFRCPLGCLCTGLLVDCTGRYSCGFHKKAASYQNQSTVLSSIARVLDVSTNHDMFVHLNLEKQDLHYLTHLNLSSCEIPDLHVDTFMSMNSLKVLDLTFNKIRHLKANMFLTQANLELFLLRGNSESLIIESEAFVGLVSLRYLDLSTLIIERIFQGAFASLDLKELRIHDSHIAEIESHSLDKLAAEGVYLNNSIIDTFKESMFQGSHRINLFVTDEYKFCCVRPLSVTEQNCYPQKDEFSSCDDLIRNRVLRPLIWVIGLFSLLSNVSSVLYRYRRRRQQLKFFYGIAVSHLAASDSLLGIYLIIIGITDIRYRGIYIYHDESWRDSAWCHLAGILSTVSCEASVIFICLITIDRFLAIKYPFGQKRLTRKNGTFLSILCWTIALILAVLPLLIPSYFKRKFYSESGLCLALPLTRARTSGWGYSFGIFIVFNSLTCLLVAIGQWSIYREIKTSKKALGDRRSKSTHDGRVTRNLLLVVVTNSLCWLPVGFIGVLALADYAIPGNVYSWIAVLVLPINSVINPVLYTLSEMLQKKKMVACEQDSKKTECKLTADDLVKCTDLWKSSTFWSFKIQVPGFSPLTEALREEWFCRKQRLRVAVDICILLHKLHARKITQEGLTIDDFFVKKSNQERRGANGYAGVSEWLGRIAVVTCTPTTMQSGFSVSTSTDAEDVRPM